MLETCSKWVKQKAQRTEGELLFTMYNIADYSVLQYIVYYIGQYIPTVVTRYYSLQYIYKVRTALRFHNAALHGNLMLTITEPNNMALHKQKWNGVD